GVGVDRRQADGVRVTQHVEAERISPAGDDAVVAVEVELGPVPCPEHAAARIEAAARGAQDVGIDPLRPQQPDHSLRHLLAEIPPFNNAADPRLRHAESPMRVADQPPWQVSYRSAAVGKSPRGGRQGDGAREKTQARTRAHAVAHVPRRTETMPRRYTLVTKRRGGTAALWPLLPHLFEQPAHLVQLFRRGRPGGESLNGELE